MKLYKYQTEEPLYYYNTKKQVEIPNIYNEKPIRGMWVSNVKNIDLPTTENIKNYRLKVTNMLDCAKSYNINTVFFQVRTTNDAFYKSRINPYSRYLTGKEGKEPPFDVLKWIISEAKKRDIDIHAWCNPYRISADNNLSIGEYLKTCDDLNFAKRHPEYIVLDTNGKLILNPAIKEVRQFIIDSMVEIVENYEVAGIHFDDYFYPYSGLDSNRDDSEQFNNQSLNLDDFRRDNVNILIGDTYKALKKVNSKLEFGISPFGIWKNKRDNEFGSNTDLACTESYNSLYADSVKWVKEGYIDYIVPQIYWDFEHKIAPFADICDFWVEVCKDTLVKLYIGHGAYRLGKDGGFLNKEEIVNQVKYANQFDIVKGNVFFTYKNFIEKSEANPGMCELKKLLNGRN